MTFKRVTPPVVEPITLEEARLHLRLTTDNDSPPSHPDDSLVSGLISAARAWCENWMNRSIAPQTVEMILDDFPDSEIQLPFSPISVITSLTYVDVDGISQVMSPALYVLDNEQEPGWVLPLKDTTWPATYDVVNGVRVRYEVGYTMPSDSPNDRPVPQPIITAMKLLLAHWYENREAVIIGTIQTELGMAVESLLLPYRLRLSMA